MFAITTDNNGDLPLSYLKEHDVGLMTLTYTVDGQTYDALHPMPDHEFYEKMRGGAMPTTAQVNPDGARAVLINITGGPDTSIIDINEAAQMITQAADPEANIIFGATFDDTLEDEVRVTVIATGFEEREYNIPNNLFSNAGEKEKKNREQQAGQEQSEQKKEPAAAAPSADDPFEDIFKIFNRNR